MEDIEYAYVGKSGDNQNAGQPVPGAESGGWPAPAGAAPANPGQASAATQQADPMESDGFMGFEAFGGNNLFQE